MRSKLFLSCALSLFGCSLGLAQAPFSESEVRLMNENTATEINATADELARVSAEIDATLQSGNTSESVTERDAIQADPVQSNNMVTVVRGNTLSGLAKKILGDAGRWRDLVEWNLDRYPSLLKNPDLILVGWQLRMAPKAKTPGSVSTVSVNETSDVNDQTTSAGSPTLDSPETLEPNDAGENDNVSAAQPVVNSGIFAANTDGPAITADSRVLHIGDSHTCGVYGKAMDSLMRDTGAKVRTYGVSGSSPSWWLQGTTGKSGYFARDEHGNIDQPADWRTPRTTPNLNSIINEYKPSVIMFSLGANLVGASPEAIRKQVETVCEIAKKAGCKVIWVGPPNSRPGVRDPEARERLFKNLREVAERYGTFVDSRTYTKYPETGGDGVHYWGAEGSAVARGWAGKVFDNIQAKPVR